MQNPSKWDLDVDMINSSTKPNPIPFTNFVTIFFIAT
jgi:hypothetical protein